MHKQDRKCSDFCIFFVGRLGK